MKGYLPQSVSYIASLPYDSYTSIILGPKCLSQQVFYIVMWLSKKPWLFPPSSTLIQLSCGCKEERAPGCGSSLVTSPCCTHCTCCLACCARCADTAWVLGLSSRPAPQSGGPAWAGARFGLRVCAVRQDPQHKSNSDLSWRLNLEPSAHGCLDAWVINGTI